MSTYCTNLRDFMVCKNGQIEVTRVMHILRVLCTAAQLNTKLESLFVYFCIFGTSFFSVLLVPYTNMFVYQYLRTSCTKFCVVLLYECDLDCHNCTSINES